MKNLASSLDAYKKIFTISRVIIWFITVFYIAAIFIESDRFDTPLVAIPWFACILCAFLLGIWEHRVLKAVNPLHNNKMLHPYAVISLVCLAISVVLPAYLIYIIVNKFDYGSQFGPIVLITIVFDLVSLITMLMSLYAAPVKGTHKGLGAGMTVFIFGYSAPFVGITIILLAPMTAVKTGLVPYEQANSYESLLKVTYVVCTLIAATIIFHGLKKYRDYAMYQDVSNMERA